ncbi:MAG: hypothetical protein Q4E61_00345 [Alphaproteobacteria bacterium]|nr:hypothetical protein [Alphaproteobacteria bacterium]
MKFLKLLIGVISLLSMDTYSETLFNQNPLKTPLAKSALGRAIEIDDVDTVQMLSAEQNISLSLADIDFVEEYRSYNSDPNLNSVPLIDVAAFFNSIKTFKFLLLNESTPTIQTMNFNSMYRHQGGYEIFRICEQQGIKPNNDTLNCAAASFNSELFTYICQHYPCDEYKYEGSCRIFCYYDPDIFVNPKFLQYKAFKELYPDFLKIYPVVAENFPKDDVNSLFKIEKAIKLYFRLINKPYSYKDYSNKIDLPIFENYSHRFYPEDNIEDAMVKTAGYIFQGKKLSFNNFSKALIDIFNDKNKEMIQSDLDIILDLAYDRSYQFGIMDFFKVLDILEDNYFYKNCFLETFEMYSESEGYYMIKFWKSWLKRSGVDYFCGNFIQDKLNKFLAPSYDVADFFESIEE